MSTLQPRPPYSDDELRRLYPANLELRQVQILLRHGERTPVSARFKNAGLAAHWPYCEAAKNFKDVVLSVNGSWDTLQWKRRLETSAANDAPTLAAGSRGEVDAVCQPGELTDPGRRTTLALGQRIRRLYVDQLGFLPKGLDAENEAQVYLRSTPIQRALESVQQAFIGLYPAANQAAGLGPKAIVTRSMQDETLFPNEGACKRFAQLSAAFAERTASLYNDGPEMAYINKKIGKWMPKESPVIKVDSHPRLSGIMDSINATRAHGPATNLPSEFYDPKVLEHVDRICTEEWFVGYQESEEYRKLGIGGLVGDLTQRMVESATSSKPSGAVGVQDDFKLSMAGCHDTTIAAVLTSLGAFNVARDKWPNFTSNIAFELFKRTDAGASQPASASSNGAMWPSKDKTWWYSIFSSPKASVAATSARTPIAGMSTPDRAKLDDHYVRIRYNDTPVTLPYCRSTGKHLDGDESFCTLAAFKEAADGFTPKDWKAECGMNLAEPAIRPVVQRPPGL
ncbi:hypothetical protein BAUCODRAFT_284402 [Baudoinia panamericana UAMH 10762]|uniref:3-phytase n=1 Tax=Baudoinia panamericana (strain UAMH 10762) TaxID=717646 RepID=M2N0Y4_BAUPA|nr:uncharacterized protein BAUCODRAFT_284402 [Baudoinia panamericana UAMH 10762]EMC92295.1 hypothetical protein BAUCODRAFT_284402 [Baudoinia panamericana UAMH 10762]